MSANDTGLQVNHLRKSFRGGSVVACEDVNLEIAQGELLVLLGPSGCGKTTTLRCIAGLEQPDNDDAIWVGQRNMTRIAPKDRNLAFVFQETALFNGTVYENILLGNLSASETEVHRAAQLAGADEFIRALPDGFRTSLGRSGSKLSVGQKQRLAIARALVGDPDLILADEPTGDLDAHSAEEIMTVLQKLNQDQGKTVIMVTHDPRASQFASITRHLDKGEMLPVEGTTP